METKDIIKKVAKGIVSLVLVIFLAEGFGFRLRNNLLRSVIGVAVATAIMYAYGLVEIGKFLWKKKLQTVISIPIGAYMAAEISDHLNGTFAVIANFLMSFVVVFLLICMFWKLFVFCFFMLIGEATRQSTGMPMSAADYDMSKYDREREEADARRAEANQRAKDRYDARTNELKARYDARTAASWGKDRAAQNFRNDADYWKKQQKKY